MGGSRLEVLVARFSQVKMFEVLRIVAKIGFLVSLFFIVLGIGDNTQRALEGGICLFLLSITGELYSCLTPREYSFFEDRVEVLWSIYMIHHLKTIMLDDINEVSITGLPGYKRLLIKTFKGKSLVLKTTHVFTEGNMPKYSFPEGPFEQAAKDLHSLKIYLVKRNSIIDNEDLPFPHGDIIPNS